VSEIYTERDKTSDVKFITSKHILDAYARNDFVGLIIYGKQGIGKSTYMLKVLNEVYGDWDLALEHVVFSLDDLIDIIKSTNKKILCVGWDDAGIHGHKYMYFRSKLSMELVSAWLDAIRTQVSSLLVTTVNPFNLIKPVRTSGFWYGKVAIYSRNMRYTAVYSISVLPDGRRYAKKLYVDRFTLRLPDEVYAKYREKRERFYKEAKEKLVKVIEKYGDKRLREELGVYEE